MAAATAAASDNAVAGVESEAALQSRLQKRDQSDNISSSRENSPSRGGQQEHVALDLALTPDEKEGKKGKKKKKKNKQVIEDAGDEDEDVLVVTHGDVVYEIRPLQEASSKYDVKMHMANERTFFKYLFASFHLGAMGTFLLTYFSKNDVGKLFLVMVTWIAAFSVIFWGLYSFYYRRLLMLEGTLKDVSGVNPHGPAYVVTIFFVIFSSIIVYAVITHQYPSKHGGSSVMGGRAVPISPTFLGGD